MNQHVAPIPPGFHTVTPHLVVADAEALIRFIEGVFAGQVTRLHRDDTGRVRHAEMKVGDSMIMLAQGNAQWPPLPAALYLYLPEVDPVYHAALAAGATSIMPPADMHYGDRCAGVKDTNGLSWWLGTCIKEVSDEEIQRGLKSL